MTNKITKRRMQQALDGLAAAERRARKWRSIVMEYSHQEFGCCPGDVDNDQYIDSVDFGGDMSVERFHKTMSDCIKMTGFVRNKDDL